MTDDAASPDTGLDADLTAWLADVLEAEVPDDADAQRNKRRLLRQIADAEIDRHLTVHAAEGRWLELGGGLALKVLHRDGATMSYLVRMAPGSVLPPHRHPVDEECVVLDGQLQIGTMQVGAGSFHLGRQGVPHAAISSESGALIFLRGAVPDAALLI